MENIPRYLISLAKYPKTKNDYVFEAICLQVAHFAVLSIKKYCCRAYLW